MDGSAKREQLRVATLRDGGEEGEHEPTIQLEGIAARVPSEARSRDQCL